MADKHNYQPQSLVEKGMRRVGRGHGSGRVKTSGRGTKGQNARGTMKLDFEGGQLALTKRLPLLRGKLRNKSRQEKPFIVKVDALNALDKGTTVTLALLKEKGIVPANASRAKILGAGKLDVSLTVAVPCSASVLALVEKAGGTSLVANA